MTGVSHRKTDLGNAAELNHTPGTQEQTGDDVQAVEHVRAATHHAGDHALGPDAYFVFGFNERNRGEVVDKAEVLAADDIAAM